MAEDFAAFSAAIGLCLRTLGYVETGALRGRDCLLFLTLCLFLLCRPSKWKYKDSLSKWISLPYHLVLRAISVAESALRVYPRPGHQE
ncbi:hypothetical protein SISSUDRAFT_1042957 [Sistotremastrum suecicum HHB10207 ss-3]|uniref:Uncharacterized protein n=1 Tax=Sistotremastrum suecicum HHB10207 ss-3 TaxID=1314776 RepID=A0A166G762_9AGAM|nr:hypothetical protein SISSUDRAFT_1042957 [Sistotremastrum suecicum HHB10207 ss-3]